MFSRHIPLLSLVGLVIRQQKETTAGLWMFYQHIVSRGSEVFLLEEAFLASHNRSRLLVFEDSMMMGMDTTENSD